MYTLRCSLVLSERDKQNWYRLSKFYGGRAPLALPPGSATVYMYMNMKYNNLVNLFVLCFDSYKFDDNHNCDITMDPLSMSFDKIVLKCIYEYVSLLLYMKMWFLRVCLYMCLYFVFVFNTYPAMLQQGSMDLDECIMYIHVCIMSILWLFFEIKEIITTTKVIIAGL